MGMIEPTTSNLSVGLASMPDRSPVTHAMIQAGQQTKLASSASVALPGLRLSTRQVLFFALMRPELLSRECVAFNGFQTCTSSFHIFQLWTLVFKPRNVIFKLATRPGA